MLLTRPRTAPWAAPANGGRLCQIITIFSVVWTLQPCCSFSLLVRPTQLVHGHAATPRVASRQRPQSAFRRSGTAECQRCPALRMAAMDDVPKIDDEEAFGVAVDLAQNDAPLLLGLLAVQLMPLLSQDRISSTLYCLFMAVGTVYLGAKRLDIPQVQTAISSKQAFAAPVISSVSLFGLYLLLKYTSFNPATAYQYMATLFGLGSVAAVGGPLLAGVLPKEWGYKPVWEDVSRNPETGEEDVATLRVSGLIAGAASVAAAAVYLYPGIDMQHKFLISNGIAWCIAMQSIGAISVSSFVTAVVFLSGLFLYDIYWVFGTDVMVTVATTLEAPVKFIYPIIGEVGRKYPFSILGLGDIVIPGIFCGLMRQFDQRLSESTEGFRPGETARREGKLSYFNSAVLGYTVGLITTFAVNSITHSGQPALLYLNPCIIGSALLTAALNGGGELQTLLDFKQEPTSSEEA